VKVRWGLVLVAANLVAMLVLAFVYPHLMVSPGALTEGHADLSTDCFACHAAFRGSRAERCVACHELPDIGLRTTQGARRPVRGIKSSFHQDLLEQDCMACHSDHQGPRRTQRSRKPFSHELLRATVRERCDGCHVAPADNLHRQIQGNCQQCHGQGAWKPARFEHDKFFVLDRDHRSACVTCHQANDYRRYTCYGCHEHTPAKIRREHLEEGITDFERCVECHRDPGVEPLKPGRKGERGERRRKDGDKD
jgi:hypothetical protein